MLLPARQRARMSLAEISMAGVATTCRTSGVRTSGAPGRVRMATSASRATSAAERQRGRSAAASAPSSRTNRSPGQRAPERAQGVHRVRRGGPLQLERVDREPRVPGDRQVEHRAAVLRRRHRRQPLQRLPRAGHQQHAREAERLEGALGRDEVAVVDRIEATAQQSRCHSNAWRPPAAGRTAAARCRTAPPGPRTRPRGTSGRCRRTPPGPATSTGSWRSGP